MEKIKNIENIDNIDNPEKAERAETKVLQKKEEDPNDREEIIDDDKDYEIVNTPEKKINWEFFLLLAFVIMLGIDVYNTRIDYFNLPNKKIMSGGYTDEFGVGGIKGVRSEFFGPNITLSVQIRYVIAIILFFLLVVSISIPFAILVGLIVISYIFAKKNVLKLIK